MTLQEFKTSLAENKMPEGISPELEAVWYAASGNWELAHLSVKFNETSDNAWIHAFLHRKINQNEAAKRHYLQAGKTFPEISCDDEFSQILNTLLAKTSACGINDDF